MRVVTTTVDRNFGCRTEVLVDVDGIVVAVGQVGLVWVGAVGESGGDGRRAVVVDSPDQEVHCVDRRVKRGREKRV